MVYNVHLMGHYILYILPSWGPLKIHLFWDQRFTPVLPALSWKNAIYHSIILVMAVMVLVALQKNKQIIFASTDRRRHILLSLDPVFPSKSLMSPISDLRNNTAKYHHMLYCSYHSYHEISKFLTSQQCSH